MITNTKKFIRTLLALTLAAATAAVPAMSWAAVTIVPAPANRTVLVPTGPEAGAAMGGGSGRYNQTVLGDRPVMFLAMDTPSAGSQSDLSGHGNHGVYQGGAPRLARLPNGDVAADFNGAQYLSVRSSPLLSVPTSGILTVESWIKPDVLQFARTEQEGYCYFLGKGDPANGYEYANRIYSRSNSANRPNRISTYDWNTNGGLGSGAYFQDAVDTSNWIMVTDVINTRDRSAAYPTGYIAIYKNGVLRGKVRLSQYNVTPGRTNAPFNVGTRNFNSWFQGSVAKVAVFNYELSAAQIARHYSTMMAGPSAASASSAQPAAAAQPTAAQPAAAQVAQPAAPAAPAPAMPAGQSWTTATAAPSAPTRVTIIPRPMAPAPAPAPSAPKAATAAPKAPAPKQAAATTRTTAVRRR